MSNSEFKTNDNIKIAKCGKRSYLPNFNVENSSAHLLIILLSSLCLSFKLVDMTRKCFSSLFISGMGNDSYTVDFSATTINLRKEEINDSC